MKLEGHPFDHAAAWVTRGHPQVGTLDDPELYGAPKIAIYTCDKQEFHTIPEGMPSFERLPPR
jgi:hypothetical protein